jgi:hypothetical protein
VSGLRLAVLAGLSPTQLGRHFILENLCQAPMGEDYRETVSRAALLYRFRAELRYVLAGYEVCRAFGQRVLPASGTRGDRPLLRWYVSREGARVAILPHPSGRNRWYNALENRLAAERFLRRLVERDARKAA